MQINLSYQSAHGEEIKDVRICWGESKWTGEWREEKTEMSISGHTAEHFTFPYLWQSRQLPSYALRGATQGRRRWYVYHRSTLEAIRKYCLVMEAAGKAVDCSLEVALAAETPLYVASWWGKTEASLLKNKSCGIRHEVLQRLYTWTLNFTC